MRNSGVQQLLSITGVVLMCSRLVQGWCDPQLTNLSYVLRQATEHNPSLEFFMHKYVSTQFWERDVHTLCKKFEVQLRNSLLNDACVSTKHRDYWRFHTSHLLISGGDDLEYERDFVRVDGSYAYRIKGNFKLGSGNYITWIARGEVPDSHMLGPDTGRMYILDIQPRPTFLRRNNASIPSRFLLQRRAHGPVNRANRWAAEEEDLYGGSLITYYSCFDGPDNKNDSIFVVETLLKTPAENNINLRKRRGTKDSFYESNPSNIDNAESYKINRKPDESSTNNTNQNDPAASENSTADTVPTDTNAPTNTNSPTDNTSPSSTQSPTNANAPTDGTSPTNTNAPTNNNAPTDNTSPTNTQSPTNANAPTDGTSPTNTNAPANKNAPTDNTSPTNTKSPTNANAPTDGTSPTNTNAPTNKNAPTDNTSPTNTKSPINANAPTDGTSPTNDNAPTNNNAPTDNTSPTNTNTTTYTNRPTNTSTSKSIAAPSQPTLKSTRPSLVNAMNLVKNLPNNNDVTRLHCRED